MVNVDNTLNSHQIKFLGKFEKKKMISANIYISTQKASTILKQIGKI